MPLRRKNAPLLSPLASDFIPVELDSFLSISKVRSGSLGKGPCHWTHFHDSMELGLCYSGSGIAAVNQQVLPFSEGDVLLVWPGQFHMVWTLEGQAAWKFLNFAPAALPQDSALTLPKLPDARAVAASDFAFVIKRNADSTVSALASALFSELQAAQEGFQFAARNLLSALVIWLRRRLKHVAAGESGNCANDSLRRLAPAVNRIATAFHQQHSIPALARLCFMSESTFRRSFHAAFGHSPLEYLLRLRLNTAAALLAGSSLSAKEIADRTGYPSASDLGRSFRKFFGVSPAAYRRKRSGAS
jgi:AraC-like DNA-binding protein